jgi:glycosyltransferase involved in cell wall biosynthesis
MSGLSILSFGFTRGLWEGENSEDVQRMKSYATQLDAYVVVTNSYKPHGLQQLRLAPNFEAIPTDAFTPLDSILRMLWIGWKVLRSRKVDLIQAQDPLVTGLVAVILGKLFRLPVNVCIYGPNAYDEHWLASQWSHRLHAPISRWVMRQSQGLQVDGQLTARRLVGAGYAPDRVAVKPVVPSNLDRFLAVERTAPLPGAPVRLLYVGRFASQKNLGMLLEVVKLLRARCQSAFELTLIGKGPGEEQLRAAVTRDGLAPVVKFGGQLPRERITEAFADADVFVLTSDYEGYPRVLMEAAAAGLPVVTTAVSGADEAIADEISGYIVPVRAGQAAAEKLTALIESPELRTKMGSAARAHIRTQLDPATNTPGQLAIWRRTATAMASSHDDGPLPKRLLLFNLVTDLKHPILGFTSQWIRELATRVESIDVITMRAGEIDLPANVRVHSAGKELGYSEPRRVVEFYRHLFRILRTGPIDGCFSHMMPEFSALGGPVLRACGIPLVTWYAHPSLTLPVKVAHFFSNRMVTSLPSAYPHRKDKLSVIGQGIDTTLFAPALHAPERDDLVLCVGRISRVKDHPTLLRAVALLPRRVRVVILGATAGNDDEAYTNELHKLVAELGLSESVTFAKPVPATELPEHYGRCAVHVNLTPAGFGDKVAWEAMSCGRPCLVANEDFHETLGSHASELLFRTGDSADLAQKLTVLLDKTARERATIGADLRAQVERLHSLPRLVERILAELGTGARIATPNAKPSLVPREVACTS